MSFKRIEDDSHWLKQLNQRRVTELLANDIPEDEAVLIKNGKYACKVCSNRPVFDTVIILSIHRNGKKHQANLVQFESQKREIKALKLKRRHDEYVKLGKVGQGEEQKKDSSLLSSLGPAYDPRVKKQREDNSTQSECEKLCKAVSSEGANAIQSHKKYASKAKSVQHTHIGSTDSTKLPQTISDYKKMIREEDHMTRLKLKPYISKRTKDSSKKQPGNRSIDERAFSSVNHQGVRTEVSHTQNITPSIRCDHTDLPAEPGIVGHYQHREPPDPARHAGCSDISAEPRILSHTQHRGSSESHSHTDPPADPLIPSIGSKNYIPSVTIIGSHSSPVSLPSLKPKLCVASKCGMSEKKRTAAKMYLKATEAGWKRDRGGTWIKDESVEFDSDEEPPQNSLILP